MKTYCLAVGLIAGLASPSIGFAGNWERTVVQKKQFDIGDGGSLRIDVQDADLELKGGGDGVEVTVELRSSDLDRARPLFESMKLKIDASGDTVSIRSRSPKRSGWSIGFGFGVKVTVAMPGRFNVDARTADGDVTIQRVAGRLIAVTEDGDVRLDGIKGKAASIRSSDGDIVVRDADVASVSLETEDGDIKTEGIRSQRLRLRTEDGDIAILLAKDKGADVNLRGEEVKVDGRVTFEGVRDEGRLSGRINGGGTEVDAQTEDGSIRLAWARP